MQTWYGDDGAASSDATNPEAGVKSGK